ncbi:MAG: hypothetical protein ACE37B_01260 [Ilumatobacter sp.]|uniref:hypothetical protein n=1 Tax=Ilumatobacter sp. TaxID=1967498 RepID=UPI00391C3D0E
MTTNTTRHASTAIAVWLTLTYQHGREQADHVWARLSDESGVEDAPSKLIYLAVAVAVAIAAGLFIIGVFNDAQTGVPDPVAPSP